MTTGHHEGVTSLPRSVLGRVPHALGGVALAVLVAGLLTSASPRPAAAPVLPTTTSPLPSASAPVPAPVALPRVTPLRARVPAAVLVVSSTPLSGADVARLTKATGARSALAVAVGPVRIGTGRTTALGVDPGTFRAWTPKGTAESDPVWRSVAGGEGSVAHVVARAFGVPLGGSVVAHGRQDVSLRVGSFATTGLPEIGLVVDAQRGTALGLLPRTGLLLSVPGADPDVVAALARRVVPSGTTVSAVQLLRRTGRWGIPAVGPVTSPFGLRMHPIEHVLKLHDGIDIGAPLGAPVYAMSDGEVLYAGPASGFGQEVVLSHPGGVTTIYGHVSLLLVTSGRVRVGQPIALVGDEGESTGPHLHAEVRVDDVPVDPLRWLRDHGVRLGG